MPKKVRDEAKIPLYKATVALPTPVAFLLSLNTNTVVIFICLSKAFAVHPFICGSVGTFVRN